MFRGMSPALRSTRYVYLAENLQMSKVGTFKPRKGYNSISLNQFIGGIYKDMAICKMYDEDGNNTEHIVALNGDKLLTTYGGLATPSITETTVSMLTGLSDLKYSIVNLGIRLFLSLKEPTNTATNIIISDAPLITNDTRVYPVDNSTPSYPPSGTPSPGFPPTKLVFIRAIPILKTGGLALTHNRSYYLAYNPGYGNNMVRTSITTGTEYAGKITLAVDNSSDNYDSFLWFIYYIDTADNPYTATSARIASPIIPPFVYVTRGKGNSFILTEEVVKSFTSSELTLGVEDIAAEYGQSSKTIYRTPNANAVINYYGRMWFGNCMIEREQPISSDLVYYSDTYFGEMGDITTNGSTGGVNTTYSGHKIGICYVYSDGKESDIVSVTMGGLYSTASTGGKMTVLLLPCPCSGDVVGRRVYRTINPSIDIDALGFTSDLPIYETMPYAIKGNNLLNIIKDQDASRVRDADNSDNKSSYYYEFKNTLMWSDVGIPTSVGITNREDFGSPAEGIVGVYGFENNLYVFKETEVWLARISGNTYPIQWKKKISDSYGCLDKNSIIEAMGNIFFLSENTFVRINGNTVDQFGKEQLGTLLTDLLDSNFVGCHAIFNDEDNELWFTVSNSGATNYGRTFIFNLDVQSWTVYNYARSAMDKLPDTPIIGLQYAATGSIFAESVLLNKDIDTSPTGSVLATSIDWKIDTGFLGQDNPMAEKVVRYITLDASDLTVTNQYDTEGDEGDNTGTGITKTATGPTRLDYIYPMDSGKKNRYPKIRLSGSTDTASTTEGEISTVVYRYQERMQDGKS
jgi:hypothetical protein